VQSLKGVPVLVTVRAEVSGSGWPSELASKGASRRSAARSKAELDLCHLEIEHAGGAALRLRADVCDYEQDLRGGRADAGYFNAPIQVLICAAAVQGPIGPFAEMAPKAWQRLVNTNFNGALNSCRAVLPNMIERRSGKIIVLACGGVSTGRPGFRFTRRRRQLLARFVESVSEEVIEHNVQINCLSPGGIVYAYDGSNPGGRRAIWLARRGSMRTDTLTGGVAPENNWIWRYSLAV